MLNRKNLKAIIPAAGNGTRGYPATTGFAKELIPLPFEGFLQNSILILVEKLVQAGIEPQNITIIVSKEKTSIRELFEKKQQIVEDLRKKGKCDFAEKVERVAFLSPAKFILQDCPFYGNQAPISTPETVEFIGKNDFGFFFPDDNFATSGRNEFEQIFDAYEKYGGSILPVKQVESDAEYDKYAIIVGAIIYRPKNSSENLILEVERIDEKPGFENAKSELASVRGAVFENKVLDFMNKYAEEFDGNGELMYQIPVQRAMDSGLKFHAVRINGWYCDTGNCYDYSLAVPAMMLSGENRQKYLDDLKKIINYFEK
ncbi:MAG: sugar phosphate nucleotidyltransferase [bacterium]|nr:sugar phosphate nucleotidyltransferase [bacterium]